MTQFTQAIISDPARNVFYRLRSRLNFDLTSWRAEKHFLPPLVVAHLIDESNGRFFEITFLKRADNAPRFMRARTGVHKWAREYEAKRAALGKVVGPQPYEPRDRGLVRVADMDKGEYRMISTEAVTRLKVGGFVYTPTTDGVWGFKVTRAPKRRHIRTRAA